MDIKIEYDGEFPNLCSGHLFVTIDGRCWDFGDHCLVSGGDVWFDDEWDEHIEEGEWGVSNWPDGFPEESKLHVVDAINAEVPSGCCGGCV